MLVSVINLAFYKKTDSTSFIIQTQKVKFVFRDSRDLDALWVLQNCLNETSNLKMQKNPMIAKKNITRNTHRHRIILVHTSKKNSRCKPQL